jgi:hypothetical protein
MRAKLLQGRECCVGAEVSGGTCQHQAAQQAISSVSAVEAQLTHVRQSIATLQSCIQSDDKVVAAEQQRAAATRESNKRAQELMDLSGTLKHRLGDRIRSMETEIAVNERYIADLHSMSGASASTNESQALKVRLLRHVAQRGVVLSSILNKSAKHGSGRHVFVALAVSKVRHGISFHRMCVLEPVQHNCVLPGGKRGTEKCSLSVRRGT